MRPMPLKWFNKWIELQLCKPRAQLAFVSLKRLNISDIYV